MIRHAIALFFIAALTSPGRGQTPANAPKAETPKVECAEDETLQNHAYHYAGRQEDRIPGGSGHLDVERRKRQTGSKHLLRRLH